MRVVLHELKATALTQKLTTLSSPVMMYAVQPYLFRFLAPAGWLQMRLQDANGRVLASSDQVTAATIGTGNYWHGFQRFLLSYGLLPLTDYYFALIAGGGYSFSESAYVGWATAFDLQNAFANSYAGAVGVKSPLGLRVWAYRSQNKGGL